MSDQANDQAAAEMDLQPDSTANAPDVVAKEDEPKAADPEPAPEPTIDAGVQAWVRRELALAASGVHEAERKVMNP